jgi:hypothetical protein
MKKKPDLLIVLFLLFSTGILISTVAQSGLL